MTTTFDTVTLGATGPTVPRLGFGTWAWGDSLYWNYGKEFSETDLQDAFKTALELGVSFFDTAEIYGFGESERLLGRFMQQTDQSINQSIAIATKYFPLPWRFGASAVRSTLEHSLKRLQRPNVTLYQVHWPFDFFMGQSTLMNAFADAFQEGKIQSIGVSNYSAEQMQRSHELLAKRGVPLAVNQVEYSLLTRRIEHNGVLATARDLGIVILAYSPLAQGLVTGKYTAENYQAPTGARKLNPRFSQAGLKQLDPMIQVLQEVGATYDRTPAQVALNWLMAQGNVIPIPGVKSAHQVRQNAGALGWQMTEEERSKIDQVTQSL